MINNKKLFLIDAYPFLYQSFYAHKKNHLFTSNGLNTSSIRGFTHFLLRILHEEMPNYMAVVFDGNQKNFRKKEYKKYKLNRKKSPKEILDSIPYITKLLKAFNIVFLDSNHGYEADDFIGTIAKKAEKKGYIVYIVTLDKDFFQLVTENIKIYCPSKGRRSKKILDHNDIQKKFNIDHPIQIIDLWSMMGDPTDNIPGFPGIGEKKAKKLLKKYGSIENLLNSINDLNGKMKRKIEKNKNIGILSKKLVTIVTNIPSIHFNKNDFYIRKPNWNSIKVLFEELEFKRLFEKAYQYYKKYKLQQTI